MAEKTGVKIEVNNQTVKRGYYLNFAEDLTPNEVSKLGERLEVILFLMTWAELRKDHEQVAREVTKLFEIAQNMKGKAGYQL